MAGAHMAVMILAMNMCANALHAGPLAMTDVLARQMLINLPPLVMQTIWLGTLQLVHLRKYPRKSI